MSKNNRIPGIGYVKAGADVYTYQIGETAAEYRRLFEDSVAPISSGAVALLNISGKYFIYPAGISNLAPNEQKDIISQNRLLPEIIEKQIRMLYGDGPALYKRKYADDKITKEYLHIEEISQWMDSWMENGLQDDYKIYLNKCIRSFYYDEGVFSKWRLNSSLTDREKRVTGLEHLSMLRCRLGTTKNPINKIDFQDSDFDYVVVGNWSQIQGEMKAYHRIDFTDPLKHNSVVSYSKNPTHGEEVYTSNKFFIGIKDWLIGSNLTPKYINSFLENSLSARLHIVIPHAWIENREAYIQQICSANQDRKSKSEELIRIKFSDNDFLDVGTEYHVGLISEYVSKELRKLTNYLSGAGKNQGKVYTTYSHTDGDGNEARWHIEEIPNKSKEYIEALTVYDKRADEVITSSKGVDSTISNVSKDGVISKSGADVLYNYLIYLKDLTIPEEVVCRDINLAIKINFPHHYNQGIRIGFYRSSVQRQEDQAPADRMSNSQM